MPTRPPIHRVRAGRKPPPPPDPRESASARGYGVGHRRWRASLLAQYPRCGDGPDDAFTPPFSLCRKKGWLTPATVADHRIPLSQGGAPYDDRNGEALCEHCHNVKRATEDKKSQRVSGG